MQTSIDQLNSKFALPGLKFETGNGDLARAVVENSLCRGEIYLHGAHVTAFQPTDHLPVLWLSEKSLFQNGSPIRGGVPICFPWFGPHRTDTSAPAHGLARTQSWEIFSTNRTLDGDIEITMSQRFAEFAVRYQVSFGQSLKLELVVSLAKQATTPESFEVALHSYFSVGDIHSIEITGLENTSYIDKVDGASTKPASNSPIRFSGECDRVYLNTLDDCELTDPVLKRVIRVKKAGSQSTVVWNPWIAKSARMADFGDNEWPGMVCIETANIGDAAVQLRPGEQHSTSAEVTSLKL